MHNKEYEWHVEIPPWNWKIGAKNVSQLDFNIFILYTTKYWNTKGKALDEVS